MAVSTNDQANAPQRSMFAAAQTGAGEERSGRGRSRLAIFLALVLVTAAVLTGVYFGARQLLLQEIDERAAVEVRQQLEDFLAHAENGADPDTAAAFGSSTRLLDTYLSTEVPGPEEIFAGLVDGHVIQMDRGEATRRLEPGSPLLAEITGSAQATGTIGDTGEPAVHWGKVHLVSQEAERPAVFVMARHTETGHARLAETLEQLRLSGLAGVGVSVPVSLILALWLSRRRTGGAAPAAAPEPRQADPEPEAVQAVPAVYGDSTYSYRRTLALTSREIDDQINHLSPQVGESPALVAHLAHLRRISDSLTGLAALLDPRSGSGRLRIDPGELTWQLAQRIRNDSGLPIQLVSTATGQHVNVNPEQLRLALHEAVRGLTTPERSGENAAARSTVEFGTVFRGEEGSRVLSLWIRCRGDGDDQHEGPGTALPALPSARAVPPIMQAVAELHGGRPWMQDGHALGTMLGVDVPVRGAGTGEA